jgi:hypothetical protein
VGALDLPSEPEEPGRADHVRDRGADRPKAREVPDPDERGRAYEATRAHVSAEAADEARPVRPAEGSYWHQAPGFLDQSADYRKRGQEDRQPTPDRSADPPGSFRSDGGSYLNPERHAEAVTTIERVREAEPAISADMQTIEQENGHGGWLEGFKCRLKGDDRLKEKVAEQLKAEPGMTAAKVLREVPDAIRYTFCLKPGDYARGYCGIVEQLENRGYEMYLSKNSWTEREYKGINTRWVTADGQRFEVQFHTPESFHAKQCVTHDAYERIRNPMIPDRERKELKDFQRKVSSAIRAPDGAAEIPDYKKKGF